MMHIGKRWATGLAGTLLSVWMFQGCGSNSKPDGSDLPNIRQAGMSIEYVGSRYEQAKGLINTYRVHLADENGKPVSAAIKFSVINGVKYMGVNGILRDTQPITFSDPTNLLEYAGPGDKVIILPGNGNLDPVTYGDWTVFETGGGVLKLREGAYHLNETGNLTYVIGSEKRTLANRVGVVHVESEQNVTVTEDGFAYFNVISDVILAGHTITLGAHIDGNRIGAALVDSIRGGNFFADPVTIPVTGGRHIVRMTLWIDPSGGTTGIEPLIDVETVPGSYSFDNDSCVIDYGASNFHTDETGSVYIAVLTNGGGSCSSGSCGGTTGGTTTDDNTDKECTLSWAGGPTSIYLEY